METVAVTPEALEFLAAAEALPDQPTDLQLIVLSLRLIRATSAALHQYVAAYRLNKRVARYGQEPRAEPRSRSEPL